MFTEKCRLKDNIKDFLIIYALICITFVAGYTFSRFVDTTSGFPNIEVANFMVTVNGVSVIEDQPFDLLLSPNSNTYEGKIVPDSSGYFEIVINPNGTEVSLEYEFKFDMSNLDSNVKLTKCILNDNEGSTLDIIDNGIKGELLISGRDSGFTDEEKLNIKVYWKWQEEGDIVNPVIEDTNIIVSSVVKQKIS